MACKYKYKDNWYSEEEIKKLLFISEFSKDSTIKEFEKYKKSNVEVDLSGVKIDRELSKAELEKIKELQSQKKEKEDYFSSKKYQQDKDFELSKLNKQLDELKNKKVEFYSQEPYLNLEDKNKYGFQDFDYVRVESTYGRGNKYHKEVLGENYEGYYIHGYNTSVGKPNKKILPISKEQAIKIWEKDAYSKYEVEDQQDIFRLEASILDLKEDSDIKWEIRKLELQIERVKDVEHSIVNFIKRNKEYEQSKEIIEQWKKENNIQYDTEEVYSRGQEFYHIHNAYSRNNVDTELWIQNLLETIQDKAKIGAKVEMSFATAPKGEVGKGLQHHNKKTKQTVYITSYPKSEDIEFVSQIDNHTSSFTDLTEDMIRALTNQKNERVGITLTKSVPLRNLHTIQPNLATTIDDVAHHNEIVIGLTPYNFRINYEEEVPYHLKKLIDNINKILDDKYGKLVKPEIKKEVSIQKQYIFGNEIFDTYEQAKAEVDKFIGTEQNEVLGFDYSDIKEIQKPIGKQPTQTRENTTSIESVKDKIVRNTDRFVLQKHDTKFVIYDQIEQDALDIFDNEKDAKEAILKLTNQEGLKEKEYTQQALTNLKVAALKEIARKYPRSLITSKVVPINPNMVDNSEIQYSKRESNSNTIDRLATSYSQMLEDENTDLDNVLKEKKLLEYLNKQIKYIDEEGNECAEFGLKTGVSGTNWRIEENLNWGKKHSEGGIDLTMTDDGIVFRRNNSDIKASHGLVIKAEDGLVMPDESNIDGEDPKKPPKYPKSIKIKDGRVKNPITGKPFNGNKSGDYDYLLMHEVVHNAKKYGIDPYNFLAMAMQETTLGKAGGGMSNPFHILNSSTIESKMDKKRYSEYFKNKTDRMRPVEMAANFYKNVKLLDMPKKKNPNIQDDVWDLQSWNGYGSIYPTTEQHIDGGGDRYGVSIPKEGINMSKNPMYGIWVKDLSNIFRDSKEVNDLVTRIYGPNAPAPYPDRIINDDVSE